MLSNPHPWTSTHLLPCPQCPLLPYSPPNIRDYFHTLMAPKSLFRDLISFPSSRTPGLNHFSFQTVLHFRLSGRWLWSWPFCSCSEVPASCCQAMITHHQGLPTRLLQRFPGMMYEHRVLESQEHWVFLESP